MTLWTIHLLAITLVMIGSFVVGIWYGSNYYGRFEHTVEGSNAQSRAIRKE